MQVLKTCAKRVAKKTVKGNLTKFFTSQETAVAMLFLHSEWVGLLIFLRLGPEGLAQGSMYLRTLERLSKVKSMEVWTPNSNVGL